MVASGPIPPSHPGPQPGLEGCEAVGRAREGRQGMVGWRCKGGLRTGGVHGGTGGYRKSWQDTLLPTQICLFKENARLRALGTSRNLGSRDGKRSLNPPRQTPSGGPITVQPRGLQSYHNYPSDRKLASDLHSEPFHPQLENTKGSEAMSGWTCSEVTQGRA